MFLSQNGQRGSLLVCNLLHSVGQNHFHIMMFFKQRFNYFRVFLFRVTFRRLCIDSKSEKSDPLHPFGRRDILSGRSTVQALSVRTTRTFLPDLPLCREPLNCSWLHPSGRLNNKAKQLSVFDTEKDFVPKHRYGKTTSPQSLHRVCECYCLCTNFIF
jgi:hypothetical protein